MRLCLAVIRPRIGSGPKTPKLEDCRNGRHVARCVSELEESLYPTSRQRVLTLRSLEAAESDRWRLRTRRHVRARCRLIGPSPGKSSDKFPRKGINKPWLKRLTGRPSWAARRSREPKYLIRPRSRSAASGRPIFTRKVALGSYRGPGFRKKISLAPNRRAAAHGTQKEFARGIAT